MRLGYSYGFAVPIFIYFLWSLFIVSDILIEIAVLDL